MSKLSQQEEKELIAFIKSWLKSHGYTQKDLANELNIKSSRTSEITQKFKELHKKGGIFNIVKNLIKIEQNWLNNIQATSQESNEKIPYSQLDIDPKIIKTQPYNQLDLIDSVVNKIKKDISE